MRLSRPWRGYSTITLKSFANAIKVSSKNAASEIYLLMLKVMKSVFLCILLNDQLLLESLMGTKVIVNSKEIFYHLFNNPNWSFMPSCNISELRVPQSVASALSSKLRRKLTESALNICHGEKVKHYILVLLFLTKLYVYVELKAIRSFDITARESQIYGKSLCSRQYSESPVLLQCCLKPGVYWYNEERFLTNQCARSISVTINVKKIKSNSCPENLTTKSAINLNPWTYKLTHISTVVQREGGWWKQLSPPTLDFVLLEHGELNLRWLDSPELPLQDDTSLEDYDLIWRQMMFDGCHGNVKNDRHNIDELKFLQRMNEQLLKVLAP